MSRRVSLPGADELFRTTGGMGLQASSPRRPVNGEARVPAPAGESDPVAAEEKQRGEGGESAEHAAADDESGGSRSRATEGDKPAGAPPAAGAGRFCLRGIVAQALPGGRQPAAQRA